MFRSTRVLDSAIERVSDAVGITIAQGGTEDSILLEPNEIHVKRVHAEGKLELPLGKSLLG